MTPVIDHAPVAQQTYYTSRDSHGRVTHGTLRMRQRNMNTKMANMNTKMARMNSEVAHSNGHRLVRHVSTPYLAHHT